MTTETIEPTFEIVPAELGLELTAKNSLELAFKGFFETAAEWKAKAETITDPKEARAARLEMKSLRVSVEKKHREMKADSLLFGRAVDGAKNIFLAMATPIERQLDDIEKAEERAAAARIQALQEERAETLDSMGHVSHGINLGMMSDDAWAVYLQQAKDVYAFRQEQEKRRVAAAEEEAKRQEEEREAQRLENIRLREEAAKAEAAAKAEREERERIEAAAKAEAEKAEKARRAAEKKAKEALEAAEVKARLERKQAEEKAKAEREKIEAVAAEERRKAIEAAAKAAKEKAEVEAEAKRLRDAEAKRIAHEKAAAAAKAKAEADAAKKAASAPDRERLQAFADSVRAMQVPSMSSDEAATIANDIRLKAEAFAKWIESQAATL
jgi:hypothetical protein